MLKTIFPLTEALTARLIVVTSVLFICRAFAQEASTWPGTRSGRPGFVRYDFQIDGLACRVDVPSNIAPGKPWVWRARFPSFHDETDRILLTRGFHVAFINTGGMLGSERAMKHWDAFYDCLTREHGLHSRPALEGVSRGGLFVYAWAARHPDRVSCIYADTPVCDIRSWPLGRGKGRGQAGTWQALLKEYGLTHERALAYDRNPIDILKPIARSNVPLLHIVSLNDLIVPPEENTFVLAKRYRALGGEIEIMEVNEGTAKSHGHHFPHPDPLRPADFVERHAATLPDGKDYFTLRGDIDNCRFRFEREGKGRVAFLGGSITHNAGWRDMTCAYLRERFPQTEFDFINAGIPSMGSTPGAFRLTRDVFGRGPVDLLFVEAAVNDACNGRNPREMIRGMEGILRNARRVQPSLDIVVMHFVDPEKMADYRETKTPVVIQQHEAVAAHTGVSTLNLAREVTERIDAGQFTWEKDFRNLHPSPYGQRLYAASIRRFLSTVWKAPLSRDATPTSRPLPDPLDGQSYDNARLRSIASATTLQGFQRIDTCDPRQNGVRGGVRKGFFNVPMLVGKTPGDSLSLRFAGRAVGIFVAAGPDAGRIEWRIDDGPWKTQELFTPWSGGLHLPWAYVLDGDLDGKAHTLSLRIAKTRHEQSKGHACRIVHFLVNDP